MRPSNFTSSTKNVTNSKNYVFFIANNQQTTMKPREMVLKETKSFPLIQNSYESFSEQFSHKYDQLMPGKKKLRVDL